MSADDVLGAGDEARGEPVRVGLYARGRKSFLAIKPAIAGVGELKRIRDLTDLRTEVDLDLIIVEADLTSVDDIGTLKICRDLNRMLPIILMAHNADPDVAVELCRVLDLDFLASPHEIDEELQAKCERGLFSRPGPTLQRPFLKPLLPEGSGMGMERRKVFRAIVPSYWASTATVIDLEPSVTISIEDLSIPYEGHQGGILFRAGPSEALAIAKSVESWSKGARLDMKVDLASEKEEIRIACRVARIPKPRTRDHFHFAVQYQTESARQDAALMRFWTNCQMQARRKDKAKGKRGS